MLLHINLQLFTSCVATAIPFPGPKPKSTRVNIQTNCPYKMLTATLLLSTASIRNR